MLTAKSLLGELKGLFLWASSELSSSAPLCCPGTRLLEQSSTHAAHALSALRSVCFLPLSSRQKLLCKAYVEMAESLFCLHIFFRTKTSVSSSCRIMHQSSTWSRVSSGLCLSVLPSLVMSFMCSTVRDCSSESCASRQRTMCFDLLLWDVLTSSHLAPEGSSSAASDQAGVLRAMAQRLGKTVAGVPAERRRIAQSCVGSRWEQS